MAGIYIHIPFCKQACHYCNFHFSTQYALKEDLLHAIRKEIEDRRDYFKKKDNTQHLIETIYFGGGTPSLLNTLEITALIDQLSSHFHISSTVEITLEANPDDLTKSYLSDLKNAGVNRLSIGIQSFKDDLLQYMNRAHTAKESWAAIHNSLNAGFKSLNIDMIFGIPGLSTKDWEQSLSDLTQLPVNHLSCYGLTIEPKTVLMDQIKKQRSPVPDEALMAEQFLVASNLLQIVGYTHYEISNYAFKEQYSKHNTAYWKNEIYLGLGPSAHSYSNHTRSWNVANNARYIKALNNRKPYYESEVLEMNDQFNEYIMTGLRTKWGISLSIIEQQFGANFKLHVSKQLQKINASYYQMNDNNHLVLTQLGWLWTDSILQELFCES
ncbi:MAG: radical SAM family heme chaperone HemW [Chitinophagales bacterium]